MTGIASWRTNLISSLKSSESWSTIVVDPNEDNFLDRSVFFLSDRDGPSSNPRRSTSPEVAVRPCFIFLPSKVRQHDVEFRDDAILLVTSSKIPGFLGDADCSPYGQKFRKISNEGTTKLMLDFSGLHFPNLCLHHLIQSEKCFCSRS